MNEFQYKAFISYRHVSPDKEIATRLHSLIENFNIPAGIRKKLNTKRMGRVFRDEEELPLSTDLGNDIEEALRNSEWLIVVCSAAYLESKWCKAELDYFISLGRRDHILTLLVDGEPDTSFPEQLRYITVNGERKEIEPLAADVRAESISGSLRKLNNEKLRILAPMLGVSFDDLRQRTHRRQMRIVSGMSLVAILMLAGLQAFTWYKNDQISRQRDIAMDNQMKLLIQEANRASDDGNKLFAVKILLDAEKIRETIGDHNDLDYSSALEYALYNEEFEKVLKIDNNNRYFSSLVFSHNDKYLLGITNLNSACLIDGSTGKILHTVSRSSVGMVNTVGFTLDDSCFYMVDQWNGYVSVYKTEDGSLYREYVVDDDSSWNIGEKVFVVDEKTLLIIKPSVMVLWNYVDDRSEEIFPVGDSIYEWYILPLIVDLSPDCKDIVIGSHGEGNGMKILSLDGSKQIDLDYDHQRGYPIIRYSGNGKYVTAVSGSRYYVWSTTDGSLILEKENGEQYLDQDILISFAGDVVLTMTPQFLKAVEVKTGEELWVKESESDVVTQAYISPDGKYVSANGGINGIYDLYSGELLCEESASLFSNDSSKVITSNVNGKADLLITPTFADSFRDRFYEGSIYATPRFTEPKGNVSIELMHNPGDFIEGNGKIYTSEDGRYAAYTHNDGFIEIFDISDPDKTINKYSHAEHCYRSVTDLIFKNDLMASCGGYDPRCVLFDLKSGQITMVLAGEEYCHKAEFSQDGSKIIILCGLSRDKAFVYSTSTGNLLYSFRCEEGEKISDVGFDEESGLVVALLDNGEALAGIIYRDIDEMLEEASKR